ncbi:DnaJ domain containing protein [Trichomonas vaginalis G3]|uniref:DnaJ domain containing protein n=1 Tax=Trichomonas vaginalis (strain ATCC PRA-98 / G3) TaxID=412133 RepID=A2DPA0_TRIV3|nr:positive regulation of translation initiation in response to endoplasmic reticulum stress [Trichomonas vaginalis G3]EAY17800.1 DnaJ domain containing protein [Trichomonas vaginalis G3]KAI5484377.1 positive regulation of translation initiation in response to endoplasmic reticulum stress [Trichomonas vaginalis G3]|eukprot:XP_001329935.1 DnaJ domain containing protein [Trichomonas vaginalis G3]
MFGGQNDPLMMVQQLRAFGQWEQEREILNQMIDEQGKGNDPLILRLRAEANLNLGNPEDALDDLEQAFDHDPDSTEMKNINMLAATAHIQLGNSEEAHRYALQADDSNLITQTTEMAKVIKQSDELYEEGKYLECAKILDRILTACSHATSLIYRRLDIAWRLGQSKVYEEKAKKLVNQYQDDTDLYFKYGVSMICNGKFADGKRYLNKAKNMENPPENISTYTQIASKVNTYLTDVQKNIDRQQYDNATNLLDEFYNISSQICTSNAGIMAKYNFIRGKLLIKQDKKDDAIELLNKAIEVDQENADYILFRANLLLKMKEYDAAIFDLTRVQRLRPHDGAVRKALLQAQEEKKKANTVDYYAIIGVDRSATPNQIKDTYRRLVRKWHPDQFPDKKQKADAEAKMKEINYAYELLMDPGKRKYYDNGGDMEQYVPGAENMMGGNMGGPMGGGIEEILRAMSQGGGGFQFVMNGGQQGGGGQQFIIFQ